jgi:nucleoside 2-deoxyribosyltransferase
MKKCFIIMPVSTPENSLEFYNGDVDHFLHVLDCLFVPAIKSCGLEPILPIVAGSDLIHAKIVKSLSSADLVLCDMAQLNPNVFFEFGIRTALNKPVALVTDEVTKNIPFDTGIINYHRYNSSLQGWLIQDEVKKLSDHLTNTIESEPNRNSLWKYFGITESAFFNAEPITPDDKLSLLIRKVDSLTQSVPKSLPLVTTTTFDGIPTYHEAVDNFKRSYFATLFGQGDLTFSELAKLTGLSRSQLHEMIRRYRGTNDTDNDTDPAG